MYEKRIAKIDAGKEKTQVQGLQGKCGPYQEIQFVCLQEMLQGHCGKNGFQEI